MAIIEHNSDSFYLFVIVYHCQLLRLLKDWQQFLSMIFHFKYYFTDRKAEEFRLFNCYVFYLHKTLIKSLQSV